MDEANEERWTNSDGYAMRLIDGILYYEHRLVWEAVHGLKIPSGHVIHHVDGNKQNNAPSNLELMQRGDHVREHNRRRREARTKPSTP